MHKEKNLLLQAIYKIVLVELETSKKPSKSIKQINNEFIKFTNDTGITLQELRQLLNITL